MEGTHVCRRPVHTDVWQKPSQYYNFLPIKINNKFKNVFREKEKPCLRVEAPWRQEPWPLGRRSSGEPECHLKADSALSALKWAYL